MNYLKVALTFQLSTSFHTTGNRRRLGADKALARDADERLVIPATTVKGFLREKVEILLHTWGRRVCIGPEPENMCDGYQPCPVCRVFGNPHKPSPVRFGDARCISPDDTTSAIRSGVTISRHRRAGYPQRLFFTETTEAAPSTWSVSCEGYFRDTQKAREAAALLGLAAAWGTTIGGGKSRGLGWLEKCQAEATLDREPISRQTLEEFWKAWEEGRNVV